MLDQEHSPICECGGNIRPGTVALTLWASQGLVVVEDVPAQVCDICAEQYYDDAIQSRLRSLAGSGFSELDVDRTLVVPVYSLSSNHESSSLTTDERQVV